MSATSDDVRDKRTSWVWLRTALVGIGICGLVGPMLPLPVIVTADAFREKSSVHDTLSALMAVPYVWPFAVVFMGPAGALLGALGALWIRFRSRNLDFKRLLFETVLAGLVLGAVVPVPMFVLGRNRDLSNLEYFVLLGGPSGIVSAVLVFLTMKRLGLLSKQQN